MARGCGVVGLHRQSSPTIVQVHNVVAHDLRRREDEDFEKAWAEREECASRRDEEWGELPEVSSDDSSGEGGSEGSWDSEDSADTFLYQNV